MRGLLERWSRWKQASVNRRIFSATIMLAAMMLVGKILAFARDILVARAFGVGSSIDAYVTVTTLLAFANGLVVIPLNTSLIPLFIQAREIGGHGVAQRLISNAIWLAVVLYGLTFITVWMGGEIFILSGGREWDSGKVKAVRDLLGMMFPGVFISAIGSTLAAVLNCEGKFKLTGLTALITPMLTFLVLSWMLVSGAFGEIRSYALATCVGGVVEGVVVMVGIGCAGYSIKPVMEGTRALFGSIMHQCGALGLGTLLMSSVSLIELRFAARVGEGAISTLNYGSKLHAAVLALGSTALGTVVLPHFSKMVAAQAWGEFRRTLFKYSIWLVVVTVPLVTILVLGSELLVRMIFERGAFTREDTLRVATVQRLFLLQVPFYVLGTLWGKAFSSLHSNQILMWGAVLSVLVCLVGNSLLGATLGVAGVALTNTLVYIISAAYLGLAIQRCAPQLFR